jgi:hypothetical protein
MPVSTASAHQRSPHLARSALPLLIGLGLAATLYPALHWWGFLVIFPWLGFAVSVGILLSQRLVGKRRLLGRKVCLLLIWPCLLLFVPIANRENFQLEGVALMVMVGFFGKGFIHYAIAKLTLRNDLAPVEQFGNSFLCKGRPRGGLEGKEEPHGT